MRWLLPLLITIPWFGERYWNYILKYYPGLERVDRERQLPVFMDAWEVQDAGVPFLASRLFLSRAYLIWLLFSLGLFYLFMTADLSSSWFMLWIPFNVISLLMGFVSAAYVKRKKTNIVVAIGIQMNDRCFGSCPGCGYRIDQRTSAPACSECGKSILLADYPFNGQIVASLARLQRGG